MSLGPDNFTYFSATEIVNASFTICLKQINDTSCSEYSLETASCLGQWLAFRCFDIPQAKPAIGTTKKGDQALQSTV